MNTIRKLTNSGEHMNYLLDNGYTEDAKRLFESQFTEGANALRAGIYGGVSHRPFAWRVGYYNPNDPVDPWLVRYFQDADEAEFAGHWLAGVEAMQAEYADDRDTLAGLLQF